MGKFLSIAAVCLLVSGCTTCGDWSKFNTFPGVCHAPDPVR